MLVRTAFLIVERKQRKKGHRKGLGGHIAIRAHLH